ncbi:hypothetical protein L1049_008418 [Liquidambar formosana]|uniref:Pentatricopeptide repeat-containing protein n=1 Tax=Liquidambar formosana TaxID=63359 RepID=A0AAP0S9S7_LIQFO
MWGIRRRPNLSIISFLLRSHLRSTVNELTRYVNPVTASNLRPVGTKTPLNSGFPVLFSSFPSSNYSTTIAPAINPKYGSNENDDDDDDDCEDREDDDAEAGQLNLGDEDLVHNVRAILDIIREPGSSHSEVKNNLEQCGITASSKLVVEVLSQVRNHWEAAFTFFLWAGKQPGYAHSVREYHSMIYILGKMRKFDTAWFLIDAMRGGRTGSSLVTPQTLLIMIRRYCAVHDVGKAINTFYAHKRFKFGVGVEEFQSLLNALCRYKNVEDAEHLLFCNKNVFPFNTKSFNIILNGWCNVIASPREAERFWREMSRRRIPCDVVSYASIISCYSKVSNLNKVLRIFDQMKEMKIAPDRKVYNAVIHALAKGRFVKEARSLMKTMEEKGIAPNTVTYNSLIKPLCRARKIDEAREVFDEMLLRGRSPTFRTYHALFHILRTGEEVFLLLEKMKKMGCHPNSDTYIMLIRKFCRWRQLDNVFKLWSEMSENGICPDRSSYTVLIHGLFLNGKLEEAYKYYIEMKEKLLTPEPMIDEMLQAWLSGKQMAECHMRDSEDNQVDCNQSGKKTRVNFNRFDQERDFRRQPETKRVVRMRGFSFWEQ